MLFEGKDNKMFAHWELFLFYGWYLQSTCGTLQAFHIHNFSADINDPALKLFTSHTTHSHNGMTGLVHEYFTRSMRLMFFSAIDDKPLRKIDVIKDGIGRKSRKNDCIGLGKIFQYYRIKREINTPACSVQPDNNILRRNVYKDTKRTDGKQ
jgi:hypothetical protein